MLRLDESDPIVVSEKVVRRIMREGAMRPVYLKRPKRWSSYAGEIGEAPANLVERDFHADAPNMLWVTDVTQFTMDVLLQCLFDRFGSVFPQCGLMVFPGVVIVSR